MKKIVKIMFLSSITVFTLAIQAIKEPANTPPHKQPKTFQQWLEVLEWKNKRFMFFFETIKTLCKDSLRGENAINILLTMEQLDESKELLFGQLDIRNQNSLVSEKSRNIYKITLLFMSGFKMAAQGFIAEFTDITKQNPEYAKRLGEYMYLELERIFHIEIDLTNEVTSIMCELIQNPIFVQKLKTNFLKEATEHARIAWTERPTTRGVIEKETANTLLPQTPSLDKILKPRI